MQNYKKVTDSDMLSEKIDTVIDKVSNLDTDAINDDLVAKFMTVSHLKTEILKEGK
jgi:hypothetical protein